MKPRHLALALLTSACLYQPACAVLLAYEGFDYSIEELDGQSGGFGWSGAWERIQNGLEETAVFSVSQDGVSLSSLAYPVDTTGGRLSVAGPGGGGGNNTRVVRPLANTFDLGQDGVLYASFLFQKDEAPSPPTTSVNNMELDLLSGTGNPVRFGSTSTNEWFVNIADTAFGPVTLEQTYFLVLKLEAKAFDDNIRSVMIFDPSQTVPTSEPEEGEWDFSNSFASSAVIDGVRLWIGRVAAGQFDEIRIGTTWESVTVDEVVFPDPTFGDFNGDGVVDAADYVWWRKFDSGNQAGYQEWRVHFGQTSLTAGTAAGITAVPEPGVWPMLLGGFLVALATMARGAGSREAMDTR